jgi:hypothetical protein
MMRGDVAGSSGNGQFLRKACARGICVYAAFFFGLSNTANACDAESRFEVQTLFDDDNPNNSC